MFESETEIPEVESRDPEAVAVAIETARALFRSGEALDGLRWLRRAAERAEESGDDLRAVHLARSAADLSTALQSVAPAPASVAPPPPPPPTPPPRPASATATPSVVPAPIVSISQSARPSANVPVERRPPPPQSVSVENVPSDVAAMPPSVAGPQSLSAPPSVPAPPTLRRPAVDGVALPAYDDYSDKTIVDRATPAVGRDAFQSGVQITDLPLTPTTEAPRSVTMPSPPSSVPGVIEAPFAAPGSAAHRAALRVAVTRHGEEPGSWLVRSLAEGAPLPPGAQEAILVALDASGTVIR